MSHLFPFPPTHAFERLQIADGLLMTADLWRHAHNYHRERQNFLYQSLNQPGIVCGLGVAVISPPPDTESDYRDGRWLQIQPGIAIDMNGNPIIVPQPETFRIESKPAPGETLLIYVTLGYVDPDQLQPQTVPLRTVIQEQFRIVETTHPGAREVELCRVLLQGEDIRLSIANDVLSPEVNCLDFRHRSPVQMRPTGVFQMAQFTTGQAEGDRLTECLSQLMQAVNVLYPAMQGMADIGRVGGAAGSLALQLYDAIYISRQQLLMLPEADLKEFRAYLSTGGVVVIGVDAGELDLRNLYRLQQELKTVLTNLEDDADLTPARQELEAEVRAFDVELTRRIQDSIQSIRPIAEAMGNPLVGSGQLDHHHLLRRFPFLFARLPVIDGHPIEMLNWGGIVLIVGGLVEAWGFDEKLVLPRETIRTAHELGINLLHFAWRRRQLTQLQRVVPLPAPPRTSPQTLRDRIV